MTFAGGIWTPTAATPPPGSGPLTPNSAALNIMTWMADNSAGDISALDMRNSFDLVLPPHGSLRAGATRSTRPPRYYQPGSLVQGPRPSGFPTSTSQATTPQAAPRRNADWSIGWIPGGHGPGLVTTSIVPSESPSAPGTAVIPAPGAGDVFMNMSDNLIWIHDGIVAAAPHQRPAGHGLQLSGCSPALQAPGRRCSVPSATCPIR